MLDASQGLAGAFFVFYEAESYVAVAVVAKAYAGEATFIEDFPLTINRFGHPEEAWFTFCYSPIRDERGRVLGMIDTVIETTGKMLAERNSRLLNAELAHRMKNTLAMIAAIASQTSEMLELLQYNHIQLGTRLLISRKFPFDNSLEVKIRNRPPVTLSAQVAKNVLVKDDE